MAALCTLHPGSLLIGTRNTHVGGSQVFSIYSWQGERRGYAPVQAEGVGCRPRPVHGLNSDISTWFLGLEGCCNSNATSSRCLSASRGRGFEHPRSDGPSFLLNGRGMFLWVISLQHGDVMKVQRADSFSRFHCFGSLSGTELEGAVTESTGQNRRPWLLRTLCRTRFVCVRCLRCLAFFHASILSGLL